MDLAARVDRTLADGRVQRKLKVDPTGSPKARMTRGCGGTWRCKSGSGNPRPFLQRPRRILEERPHQLYQPRDIEGQIIDDDEAEPRIYRRRGSGFPDRAV